MPHTHIFPSNDVLPTAFKYRVRRICDFSSIKPTDVHEYFPQKPTNASYQFLIIRVILPQTIFNWNNLDCQQSTKWHHFFFFKSLNNKVFKLSDFANFFFLLSFKNWNFLNYFLIHAVIRSIFSYFRNELLFILLKNYCQRLMNMVSVLALF